MGLEEAVEERFQRLIATSLGLSLKGLRRPSPQPSARPSASMEVAVDYLGFFEASVAATLMDRMGLREGVEYLLIPEGVGGRFMLALKRGVGGEALEALDRLRRLSAAKPVALRILKEWRATRGERCGDVDEAIHLALRVVEVREKLTADRCPRCGGSAAKVVERLRGGRYEVFVERTCCGYAERAWLPLAPPEEEGSRARPTEGKDK